MLIHPLCQSQPDSRLRSRTSSRLSTIVTPNISISCAVRNIAVEPLLDRFRQEGLALAVVEGSSLGWGEVTLVSWT